MIKTIRYIITSQNEVSLFNLSMISLYDDIVKHNVKVILQTNLIPEIQAPDKIDLHIVDSSDEGIVVPTNTIFFPGSIENLSEQETFCEENTFVKFIKEETFDKLCEQVLNGAQLEKNVYLFNCDDKTRDLMFYVLQMIGSRK